MAEQEPRPSVVAASPPQEEREQQTALSRSQETPAQAEEPRRSTRLTAESDWIDRLAADIRELNPDYEHFEAEVASMIRRALSAPLSSASPEGTGRWLPISEAPKRDWTEEGVRALVADSRGWIGVADRVCVYPDGSIGGLLPAHHGRLTDWGITHYMPLPPAPPAAIVRRSNRR